MSQDKTAEQLNAMQASALLIRAAIADDAYAISFQSMAEYRTDLVSKIDGLLAELTESRRNTRADSGEAVACGDITSRRVIDGKDVFTVTPRFGEPFEVVRFTSEDGCTESNCPRCLAHPNHRNGLHHAGISTHPRATAVDVRLVEAVRAVYYAGIWSCDRPVDEAALWTELRDAAGFMPGQSPAAIASREGEGK